MILHLERKFTAPTETFIANQINFQDKYKSIVFTINYLNSLKIDAQVFESASKSFFAGKILLPGQISYFKEVFNEQKPSLIHGHFLTDSSFYHPLTKQLDVPKLCSGYGYDVSSFPKTNFGLGKNYFKRIFKDYDKFAAMSNDMANDLIKIGCPQEKIIVHYYGTDTQFFNIPRGYEDVETLNLLTISSLTPKKGHMTILKALKHLKDTSANVKLQYTIVGKGPLLDSLQKFVQENGMDNMVRFVGAIKYGEGLLEEIKKAHVFVHPSVTDAKGNKEGIPGAIVEAMASGLPVISTFHAGIPEIIADGQDGLLVKEYDHLGVAERIHSLYKDRALRENIGSAAKHTALTKLDLKAKTEELKRIYTDLL